MGAMSRVSGSVMGSLSGSAWIADNYWINTIVNNYVRNVRKRWKVSL